MLNDPMARRGETWNRLNADHQAYVRYMADLYRGGRGMSEADK
jgi:hypothetical protein